MEKLIKIQKELKAPKSQRNNFGNYNYRNCEDILEAVKPLLSANGCLLTITDEIIQMGTRFYIKASAIFTDGKTAVTSCGFAREAEVKKGMDEAQITGAASSYARKYALNALFLIDDTKDADFNNKGEDKTEERDPKTAAKMETHKTHIEAQAKMAPNPATPPPAPMKVVEGIIAEHYPPKTEKGPHTWYIGGDRVKSFDTKVIAKMEEHRTLGDDLKVTCKIEKSGEYTNYMVMWIEVKK